MTRILGMAILLVAVSCILDPALGQDKKAQAIKGWGVVVDPDGDCKIAETKGKLTITLPKVAHDFTYREDYQNLNAPRVLQDVDGDFLIEVRINPFPRPETQTSSNGKFSFVGAGLTVWLDAKNFIRLERSAEGNAGSLFVWLERFQNGKSVARKQTNVGDLAIHVQVERKGNRFAFLYKVEGAAQTWTVIQTQEIELPAKLKVGVHALNTTTREFAAELQEFQLNGK